MGTDSTTIAFSPNERTHHANNFNSMSMNQTSTYASSTENISRLLEGWMRSSSSSSKNNKTSPQESISEHNNPGSTSYNSVFGNDAQFCKPKGEEEEEDGGNLISHEDIESILSFENLNSITWENKSSICDHSNAIKGTRAANFAEKKEKYENTPPLTSIENWFLDEPAGQVEGMMEISPMF